MREWRATKERNKQMLITFQLVLLSCFVLSTCYGIWNEIDTSIVAVRYFFHCFHFFAAFSNIFRRLFRTFFCFFEHFVMSPMEKNSDGFAHPLLYTIIEHERGFWGSGEA